MSDRLLNALRATTVAFVADDRRALTVRQLAVLLTCYLEKGRLHRAIGLAADLRLSAAAITRALDRLTELDLAVRLPDPSDGRGVLVGRTQKGEAFLRELGATMVKAGAG